MVADERKISEKRLFGIRVRQLKKADRVAPTFYAWAVEVGVILKRKWQNTVILERHATELAASGAMCRILQQRKKSEM